MKKNDEKIKIYENLSGYLDKKSTNFIAGYQQKYWEIFDSGKRIAYRNPKQADYREENIFLVNQCEVSEAGDDTVFELTVNSRMFVLRADTQQQRDQWIQAITFLKKYTKSSKKNRKKKLQATPTSSTLASKTEYSKKIPNPQQNQTQANNRPNNRQDGYKTQKKSVRKPPQLHSITSIKQNHIHQVEQQKLRNSDNKKQKKSNTDPFNSNSNIQTRDKKSHSPDRLNFRASTNKIIQMAVQELKNYLSKEIIKYHMMLTTLSVKQEGLFGKNNYNQNVYLLVSPKSLYPDIHISKENVTNLSLPPWLQINIIYRVDLNTQANTIPAGSKNSLSKFILKPICKISQIIDIQMIKSDSSFKINTGDFLYELYANTLEQRQCIIMCLNYAINNAKQVMINGKISKQNYDRFVKMVENQQEQDFRDAVYEIIQGILPPPENALSSVQPLLLFLQKLPQTIQNFLKILSKKQELALISSVKTKQQTSTSLTSFPSHKSLFSTQISIIIKTIQNTLQILHQELIVQLKRTWVSLYPMQLIKTIDILNMLKYLSEYTKIVHEYIRSQELLEGMKQLSKIYVRDAWKNFQTIILAIVEQEKKGLFLQQSSQDQWIRTNAVNDLFKFIYDVYEIAYPHWNSKIHLRNVNKLIQRAIQVFTSELRSLIDEQFLPTKQLVALANNYFDLNQYTMEFYRQKFESQLHEKTQEKYQALVKDYREIALIIIEKLANNTIRVQLQNYFRNDKTGWIKLNKVKTQEIFTLILNKSENAGKLLHMAFQKKYYDHIAKKLHQLMLCLVENQAMIAKQIKLAKQKKDKKSKTAKKIPKAQIGLSEICELLKILNADFIQMFKHLGKSNLTYARYSKQIENLLQYDLHADIKGIIDSNPSPIKQKYREILYLRNDYYQGSVLFCEINKQQESRSRRKSFRVRSTTANKHRKNSADNHSHSRDNKYKARRQSFTAQYFEEEMMLRDRDDDRSSISSLTPKKDSQKLISCGYMQKGKRNKALYEKQYFRLKNGILYFYASQQSDHCSNKIALQSIKSISLTSAEKPTFLLKYGTLLNKQKQIKLRCQNIELRDRWMTSLQLEKKRLINEQKIKNKKIIKKIETQPGRKKNQLIIDFWELQGKTDYFSYE